MKQAEVELLLQQGHNEYYANKKALHFSKKI
jgi:hypothetical protein